MALAEPALVTKSSTCVLDSQSLLSMQKIQREVNIHNIHSMQSLAFGVLNCLW